MYVGGTLRLMVLLVAMVAATTGFSSSAAQAQTKYAALVIDASTGHILHQSNADARRYPASLTKMMTLYMAFEALETGRWTLDRRLPVSARAAAQPPSKLGLRKGQTIRVRHAILALVTKSANDVAVVIAEALAGSESRFGRVMTGKARQLGMARTTFRNASGLPDPQQVTTARDMAILAAALLRDFPQFYHYFSTRSFAYKGNRYRNHNRLLGRYDGVDGIKTGYIRASGFNLAASARRGGRRIIGIVFGGKTAAARNKRMASLLDEGFRRLETTVAADMSRPRIGIDLAAASAFPSVPAALRPGARADARWAVQVGAFDDAASAEREARRAAQHVRSLTRGALVKVEPSRGAGRKTVYTARIANVIRETASRACQVLRRKRFRCMIVRLDDQAAARLAQAVPVIEKASRKPRSLQDLLAAEDSGRAWGIQVGAYGAPEPALARATEATAAATDVLARGRIAVVRPAGGQRSSFYLAQVRGLSEGDARSGCTRLRGRGIDCLVIETVDNAGVGWDATGSKEFGLASVSTKPSPDRADPGAIKGPPDWGIQVGAFPRSKLARQQAEKAVRVLPNTLEPGRVTVVPLTRTKRGTVYRARIVGIDKGSAYQACRLLELEKIPCMVLRATDADLAAADPRGH